MKTLDKIRENQRLIIRATGHDGGAGHLKMPGEKRMAAVIWSFGGGWEHVSMSYDKRVPTWQEMCCLKDMFFHDHETVVQYHPAKEDCVNKHPHCLHLWRPIDQELPKPPKWMVG